MLFTHVSESIQDVSDLKSIDPDKSHRIDNSLNVDTLSQYPKEIKHDHVDSTSIMKFIFYTSS